MSPFRCVCTVHLNLLMRAIHLSGAAVSVYVCVCLHIFVPVQRLGIRTMSLEEEQEKNNTRSIQRNANSHL